MLKRRLRRVGREGGVIIVVRRQFLCTLARHLTNDGIGSTAGLEVFLGCNFHDVVIARVGVLRDEACTNGLFCSIRCIFAKVQRIVRGGRVVTNLLRFGYHVQASGANASNRRGYLFRVD